MEGTEQIIPNDLSGVQSQINAIVTLLNSDNVNLDTVQELVDAIETLQLSLSTILVNDLTTGGVTKALTAQQGIVLKGMLDSLSLALSNKENSFTVLPISKGGTNSNTALNNSRIIVSKGGKILEQTALTPTQILVVDANGLPVGYADFIRDANGKIGIGSVSPLYKLDVNGSVVVRDEAIAAFGGTVALAQLISAASGAFLEGKQTGQNTSFRLWADLYYSGLNLNSDNSSSINFNTVAGNKNLGIGSQANGFQNFFFFRNNTEFNNLATNKNQLTLDYLGNVCVGDIFGTIGGSWGTSLLDVKGNTSAINQFRLREGVAFTGTHQNGDIWNDSTNKSLNFFTAKGINEKLCSTIWRQFNDLAGIAVLTTATNILTNVAANYKGSRTLSASHWEIGNTIYLRAQGILTKINAAASIALNVTIGGTSLGLNGSTSTLGGVLLTNVFCDCEVYITATSSSTCRAWLVFTCNNVAIKIPTVNVASLPTGIIELQIGASANNTHTITTQYAEIQLT